MRSRKGIAVGYIVLLILALAIGIVALLISAPIYESVTHELDTFCVIENSLKEIVNIEPFYEVSSKGSCKTSKLTVRATDMSKNTQIQLNCPELIDDFGDDLDRWIEENPTLAVQECAKSKLLYSAEKCWRSYLEGEAGFGNKCSEVCLAPGFLSYKIDKTEGEITFPKIENSQLFIFEGIFNPDTFTLTDYDLLRPLDNNLKNALFEDFQESNTETTQTINWDFGAPSWKIFAPKGYSLVVQFSSPGIDLASTSGEFPQAYKSSDQIMDTEELWSISYIGYEVDPIEGAVVGGLVGGRAFGLPGVVVGAAAGVAVEMVYPEESYILLENVGTC